jgi:hypothetical protein
MSEVEPPEGNWRPLDEWVKLRYVVEVADLNEHPTAGYLVGPFRDESEAQAWQPPPGVVVVQVREMRPVPV